MIKLSAYPSPTNSYYTHYSLFSLNQQASSITLDHRGLAYGDGFFSTMGVYQGKILWRNYHVKRLQAHSTALQLDFDTNWVMRQLKNLAKQLKEGVIKIFITRKQQVSKGYGFTKSEADIFVKTIRKTMPAYQSLTQCFTKSLQNGYSIEYTHSIPVQAEGQAVCLTSQIACLPMPLIGLKSLNRLDSVLAAGELEKVKLQFIQSMYEANKRASYDNSFEDYAEDIDDANIEGIADYHNDNLDVNNENSVEIEDSVDNSDTDTVDPYADVDTDIYHIIQAEISADNDIHNNPDNTAVNTANNHEYATYTDMTGTQTECNNSHVDIHIVEGLVADVSGEWVEGVSSNVFYQLKNENNRASHYSTWYTTPIDQSGVNGVMRQLLIEKAKNKASPIEERQLTDEDLPRLSALFFCNAVRGIIPINALYLLDEDKVALAKFSNTHSSPYRASSINGVYNSSLGGQQATNNTVVELSVDSVHRFALQFSDKFIKPKPLTDNESENQPESAKIASTTESTIDKPIDTSAESDDVHDKVTHTKPDMDGYSIFYALFHVQTLNDNHSDVVEGNDSYPHESNILGEGKGAFVNTYMLAKNKVEFYVTIKTDFSREGLVVVDMEDYENLECIPDEIDQYDFGLDEDSYEIVKALSPEQPLGMLYHVYDEENAEDEDDNDNENN